MPFSKENLSVFQIKCLEQLKSAISSTQSALFNISVTDDIEPVITSSITGCELKVLIYTNKARIIGAGLDEQFALGSYDNESELTLDFCHRVIANLRNS